MSVSEFSKFMRCNGFNQAKRAAEPPRPTLRYYFKQDVTWYIYGNRKTLTERYPCAFTREDISLIADYIRNTPYPKLLEMDALLQADHHEGMESFFDHYFFKIKKHALPEQVMAVNDDRKSKILDLEQLALSRRQREEEIREQLALSRKQREEEVRLEEKRKQKYFMGAILSLPTNPAFMDMIEKGEKRESYLLRGTDVELFNCPKEHAMDGIFLKGSAIKRYDAICFYCDNENLTRRVIYAHWKGLFFGKPKRKWCLNWDGSLVYIIKIGTVFKTDVIDKNKDFLEHLTLPN